jgi:hypothetical protein
MKPFKTKPKKEYSEKSEEQRHYEYVLSFLKWAIGITGSFIIILVAIAQFGFYKDRSEFKAELSTYLKDSKEQIHEMAYNANLASKETMEQSHLTINSLKGEAEKYLQNIKEETKSLALSETDRKVNEAFKDKSIQKVIDDAAKNEVESSVKEIVTEKLKPMSGIILAVDKIRAGDRKSFMMLDSLSKYSKDTYYKAMADSIVKVKTNDYEESIPEFSNIREIANQEMEFFHIPIGLYKIPDEAIDTTELGCRKMFDETKKDLQENPSLNYVALDFKILRFLTGTKIKMFDFEAAKKLQYKEGIKHPK